MPASLRVRVIIALVLVLVLVLAGAVFVLTQRHDDPAGFGRGFV